MIINEPYWELGSILHDTFHGWPCPIQERHKKHGNYCDKGLSLSHHTTSMITLATIYNCKAGIIMQESGAHKLEHSKISCPE